MGGTLSHEIKVGFFVVIGLALFCVSVVLLGGDKFALSRNYQLKVHLPQSQGLGVGSVVSLTGVPVGNISAIHFVPGLSDVEITISVEAMVEDRITEGSQIAVKTQGALGDKYLYITPGPAGGKPLARGSTIDIDKTPDFLDIIASKGAEMGEVVEVVKEVHLLLRSLNRDGRTDHLVTNLLETSENLNKFVNDARQAMLPLASVMQKVDKGQGTLGALVNDRTLHNQLTGFFGQSPRNSFLKPLIRESIQATDKK